MPDALNKIPLNTPPEVKINKNTDVNKIPSNIKIFDKKGHTLGKDDFLKLFVTQLSKQDPMNPVNDREFIAQMAQFSALEQMNNVSANISELKSMQANTMVGKFITGKDVLNGNMISGEVTRIIYDNSGNIFLRTKDNTVQLKDLTSVENIVKEPENNANVSRETMPKNSNDSALNMEKIEKIFSSGASIFTNRALSEYSKNGESNL